MKISKQLNKLKNLIVMAEKCSTREEAKKIIYNFQKYLIYTNTPYLFLSIYVFENN